ncbi:hypothetical protein [Moritella viscosa]|uniref:Uncharacterized protein n=1 Tax=Moritella viscosa TaxID=80854 RepID=A0A1L0A7W1_9GAMM|nr:hypothetical protein [Moritella viscosa]SGZ10991.1 Putative uncharacterized protein [Moritella viscosa]SHO12059.1 Putative uncharacterized protein [Moritella viscosa]SHO12061.1 Putative uncharacterized protein [Moritella viscosa]SHO16428.1 Putative uncharacterized protein [Moritella viscosa]SHO18284.1 Putative uncharacterized protein [Moritella viscosa]
MIKLGQVKYRSQVKSMSKWSMTCVIAELLIACVSDGQYDSNDSEIALPDKAVE